MSLPLKMTTRLKIVSLKAAGMSCAEIARQQSLSYMTVRNIWQRFEQGGEQGLSPAYDNCGQQTLRSSYFFYRCSCWLKRLHPLWGAPFIHLQLKLRYGSKGLPSIRTMQRWYRQKQLNRPRSRNIRTQIGRSKATHNIWQLDAKEQLTLLDGQKACYLTIIDEFSGACLAGLMFAYHRISQVPLVKVRTQLIEVFRTWGTPKAIRVDNGLPFGSPEPSTTPALSLWLIAMGLKVIANPPASPQKNGCVEKMQDTSQRWAEIKKCPNIYQAQKQLDRAILLQRELYPVTRLEGKTRIQAFPELTTIFRPWEDQIFEPQRVYDFLAKKSFTRKVSAGGQFFHMSHRYSIGVKFKKQFIILKFDPQNRQWKIFDTNNQCVKTFDAAYLSPLSIQNLTVFSRNS